MSNHETIPVLSLFDGLTVSCEPNETFCVFWLRCDDCLFAVTDGTIWAVARDKSGRNGTCLVFNGSKRYP
jgi:hypothetical protein